jgi:hypothetical protein
VGCSEPYENCATGRRARTRGNGRIEPVALGELNDLVVGNGDLLIAEFVGLRVARENADVRLP